MSAPAPRPLRETLTPEVERAARTIHREVWKEPYRPGVGPMHYAGGGYWRGALLRRATQWERMAEAARVCAAFLPPDDELEGS